jgi:hypothetical protein
MNYLDPARPKLGNGAPCYCDENGKPIAALQPWNISAHSGELIRVMIFLSRGGASIYSAHWIDIHPSEFEALWTSYLDDPERTMRERFSWNYGTWITESVPATAIPPRDSGPRKTASKTSVAELDKLMNDVFGI